MTLAFLLYITIVTSFIFQDELLILLSHYSTGIYLFKVSNENTRLMYEFKINNKDTKTTSMTSFWCL